MLCENIDVWSSRMVEYAMGVEPIPTFESLELSKLLSAIDVVTIVSEVLLFVYGTVTDEPVESSYAGKAIMVPFLLSGYMSVDGAGGFAEVFILAYA